MARLKSSLLPISKKERKSQFLTGKSFSEALILASTNPQYNKRLFIELRVQYIKIPSSEHVENMLCIQIVFCFDIQNNFCTQHFLQKEKLLIKIYLYVQRN